MKFTLNAAIRRVNTNTDIVKYMEDVVRKLNKIK